MVPSPMNVSQTDASVRLWASFGMLVLTVDFFAVAGQTAWVWVSWILAALTVLLAVTGLSRVCPLYGLLGITGAKPAAHSS